MTQTPSRDWQKDMEMCEAATEGPWYSIKAKTASEPGWYNVLSSTNIVAELIESEANAKLMAEAHAALPYWLQEAKERGEREQQSKELLEKIDDETRDEWIGVMIKDLLSTLYPDTPAPKEGTPNESVD